MRILHVVPTYLPAKRYGGPIYSVHSLCAALARQGHDVEVFTTNVDGPDVSPVPLGTPVDLDGIKVTYFATGFGRRFYRSPDMGAALSRRMPYFDVAHLHSVFLWPTSASASAARRAGVPYVLSPRGMLVADLIRRKSRLAKATWISLLERRNVAGAAAVHVTSNIEGEELRWLGLEARRLSVIANGMDLPPKPTFGSPFRDMGAGRPTVLCLGRVNWKKGIDRLIKAMALVPDARLVIAGNDEEGHQRRLEELARQHGVAARTEFTGPVLGQAKWDLIAKADVFALPSYSENFGNAVLEAMACGVPVVVTPQVGLAATVSAESAGLVVDADPQSVAGAIRRLLKSPEERTRMGENGRRTVAEKFSWNAIARAMIELYADITAGTQPST